MLICPNKHTEYNILCTYAIKAQLLAHVETVLMMLLDLAKEKRKRIDALVLRYSAEVSECANSRNQEAHFNREGTLRYEIN